MKKSLEMSRPYKLLKLWLKDDLLTHRKIFPGSWIGQVDNSNKNGNE